LLKPQVPALIIQGFPRESPPVSDFPAALSCVSLSLSLSLSLFLSFFRHRSVDLFIFIILLFFFRTALQMEIIKGAPGWVCGPVWGLLHLITHTSCRMRRTTTLPASPPRPSPSLFLLLLLLFGRQRSGLLCPPFCGAPLPPGGRDERLRSELNECEL